MNEAVLKSLGKRLNDADPALWRVRDAVHIAVVPALVMQAGGLSRAEKVAVFESGSAQMAVIESWPSFSGILHVCRAVDSQKAVGIVDPYLPEVAHVGDLVWVFLMPGSITSLRHVWTHPLLDDKAGQSPSEQWLQAYARSLGVDFEVMLAQAALFLDTGEYWNEGEKFDGVELHPHFWKHYSDFTGREVGKVQQHSFFSCAC